MVQRKLAVGQSKFNVGDRVIGNEKRGAFWGCKGTIVEHESPGRYLVKFDDGRRERVSSSWLDAWQDNPPGRRA